MICYLDRAFCSEWGCGDPDCRRRLTTEHKKRANALGLGISMTDGCVATNLPPDGGLKEQVRPYGETFSPMKVVGDEFFGPKD